VCEPISGMNNYYRCKNPSGVWVIYGPLQILPLPKIKTVTTPLETYIFEDDARLTTRIGWNLPYKNSPGKTCEMRLEKPTISKTSFIDNFIKKDPDWQLNDHSWTQCVEDSDGEFLFELKHDPETLSIHVRRSDFLEPNLCAQ